MGLRVLLAVWALLLASEVSATTFCSTAISELVKVTSTLDVDPKEAFLALSDHRVLPLIRVQTRGNEPSFVFLRTEIDEVADVLTLYYSRAPESDPFVTAIVKRDNRTEIQGTQLKLTDYSLVSFDKQFTLPSTDLAPYIFALSHLARIDLRIMPLFVEVNESQNITRLTQTLLKEMTELEMDARDIKVRSMMDNDRWMNMLFLAPRASDGTYSIVELSDDFHEGAKEAFNKIIRNHAKNKNSILNKMRDNLIHTPSALETTFRHLINIRTMLRGIYPQFYAIRTNDGKTHFYFRFLVNVSFLPWTK